MKTNCKLYLQNIGKYTAEKKRLKLLSVFFTFTRLLLFVAIVFFFVLYVKHAQALIWLVCTGLSIVALAFAAKKDAAHLYNCRLVEQLLQINETELNYLNQKMEGLDEGADFIDPSNSFTSDLDIFGSYSIFQAINRTGTSAGRSKLAHWLSSSLLNKNQIEDSQEAVRELREEWRFRQLFQAIGQLEKDSLLDLSQIEHWLAEASWLKNKGVLVPILYLAPILTLGSILAAVFVPQVSAAIPETLCLLMLVITCIYLKLLNQVHQQLGQFSKAFSKYARLLQLVKDQNFKSAKLSKLYSIFFGEGHHAAKAFISLSKILDSFDQRANVFVAIVFNALYLRDLQLLVKLEKWKSQFDPYLQNWVEATTEIDVLNCLANFSFNHSEFVFPEISDSIIIEAKQLGHPLIATETRVDNDLYIEKLGQFNIVTGANMAGKSTFLRAVGVNLLLASSGAPVCAQSFKFKPVTLFTSMRTTDNLAKHTSYFHAELLRLKLLMESAQDGKELFVILDEILKGTNSTDKLLGSQKFLTRLKDLPIAGLVATHDLPLGELSSTYSKQFTNICFEVEIADKNIKFDYKLREGVSQNMNATVLMEQMGIV